MKNKYLLLMLLSCMAANAQVQWPEAKIEAHIVDESGQAISNASTTIWFTKLKTNNPFDGQDNIVFRGISDGVGNFAAISQTLGLCGAGAEKDGYYASRAETRLGENKNNKWVPWHRVIELRLRKKELPISMYAKKLERVVVPVTNSPVGYDLMAGDWVSPHGKGVTSDLVFTLQREIRGAFDLSWQLSVNFSGDGNGWQAISPSEETPQSELRFPRIAPADGYLFNDMFLAFNRSAGKRWETNSTSVTNYFFRVRTEYDENKQLKSAFYGKLLGPIRVNVQGTKTAKLYFTYYLNPTPLDRNLEFDPKKNLFKGLSIEENVREP